jgi:DNA mismatch repair ATPase MutS
VATWLTRQVVVVDQVKRVSSNSSGASASAQPRRSGQLADREVTRVFTSGTITSEAMMGDDKQEARYLLAITERPVQSEEASPAAAAEGDDIEERKEAAPASMQRSTSEVEYVSTHSRHSCCVASGDRG